MSNKTWAIIKPFVFVVSMIVAVVVATKTMPLDMAASLQNLVWLPHVLLVIAMGISWQYGQSRLFLACLLLFVYVLSPVFNTQLFFTYLYRQIIPAVLVVCMAALLADRERGFSFVGIYTAILSQLVIAVGACLFLMYLQTSGPVWLMGDGDSNPIFKIGEADGAISLLYLFVTIFASARYFLAPSGRNTSLYLTALTVMVVAVVFGTAHNQLAMSALPLFFVISILIESHNMAFKDELTGIKGRRALMQSIPALGKRYTVVMSDVDKFKNFNDTYGHETGDQVLKLVAAKLEAVGGGGKAYRYGGEEFTLVFPYKTAEEALPYVEAVRMAIASYNIVLRDNERDMKTVEDRGADDVKSKTTVRVTSSFGVAEKTEGMESFGEALKAADIALYQAKNNGRNCTVVYNDGSPSNRS